ncbi:MAG: prepilin-type N-terminal cleavage/methylation domain-containing protein [Burkholderiaceae bacterium]|nr:prepilin-type N-terminal cleavage/methylation domain-containing protein [Burkholderiaceae bacterium]
MSSRAGFTLLEMLVTLVLVSLVSLLLSQAMWQISRVEHLMSGGQVRSMASSLHGEWTRNALEGLLPGQANTPERFKGDALMLTGLSSAVPRFPEAGVGGLSLSLQFDPARGLTELVLDPLVAGSSFGAAGVATPVVLLNWPGQAGRWRYQDAAGDWHDSWPPPLANVAPALPVLIALDTGLPDLAVLYAAPQGKDAGLPTRRAMEGQ